LGQAKWITCVSGAIIDVIADIRPNSPTFKQVELIRLDPSNQKSLLVGEGLGHGFISLTDDSIVSYLLSSEYNPLHEYELNFFDKDLSIDISHIPLEIEPSLSEKDRFAPSLYELEKQNLLPNYHQRKH
jgi:dTDP-4-dehydrorhamnose 3,5-epimerase